ncbi:protein FAM110C [Chanos chanos]|uniref:Protein FAM110C n=1 Tax=Chanos chanos TaxID=29144 RepID=A0A6J2WG46_CHACN|nr:protein FAM110C [Chanos chanos]
MGFTELVLNEEYLKMQSSTDLDTSRILEKGPDYLRKQMELESEGKGRMSAVERLAATKPKYVKSQQVVNSTQEPVLILGSSSVSSQESSSRSGVKTPIKTAEVAVSSQGQLPPEDNVVRRSSSKKRPDSLLLYRQKCDLLRGSSGEQTKRKLVRKRLENSLKDRTNSLPETRGKESDTDDIKGHTHGAGKSKERGAKTDSMPIPTVTISPPEEISSETAKIGAQFDLKDLCERVTEVDGKSRKGVGRSHSDISSRYSKNFADFDAFFKYCGLESDVIESLGKENFSSHSDEHSFRIRSVSVATSEDEFSRSSGDSDGLMEEELKHKTREGTSVIERNARIIKWLYSCRNATQSGKTLRDLE